MAWLTMSTCICLPLKHSTDLQHLQDDSQDVYTTTRFETYLLRHPQLTSITYPEYYQWWRPAASSEQRKAESAAAKGKTHSVNPRGTDDFAAYLCARSVLEDAQLELVCHLEECDMAINTMDELLALLYLARFRGVPTSTRDALPKYHHQQGIDPPVPVLAVALPEAALQLALTNTNLEDEELGESLATYHWLMQPILSITFHSLSDCLGSRN